MNIKDREEIVQELADAMNGVTGRRSETWADCKALHIKSNVDGRQMLKTWKKLSANLTGVTASVTGLVTNFTGINVSMFGVSTEAIAVKALGTGIDAAAVLAKVEVEDEVDEAGVNEEEQEVVEEEDLGLIDLFGGVDATDEQHFAS